VGTESAFDTPYSQLILRIYAATNQQGAGTQTDFAPSAGNPRYATAANVVWEQWRSEAKCRPGPTMKVSPFPTLNFAYKNFK